MEFVPLSLTLILSILCGALFTKYLTVHPLKMSRYLFVTTLVLVVVLFILATNFSGVNLLFAGGLSIVLWLVGYLVMARIILSREDSHSIPELLRESSATGLGHTAVIYFTHGEPETYDPIGWINQFREFDEQKIPFVPLIARPFFLYALRKKYLKVGKSEHHSIHRKMIKSLENAYRSEGDLNTRFYLSFLDDNPHPDAAVIQALNDGASRIVVSEVFLTISHHTAEGKELIEGVLSNFKHIPVRFTGPLYDSQILQKMFLTRANMNNGHIPKEKIGVLLVGHGQPDEWDLEWPTETEQEIGFRMDVLRHFEADGYRKGNLSLAWMEFKEPKPAPKINDFLKNGVDLIYYFPAAISADSIHSQYDIPELVHKAKIPKDLEVINLGAWNDDPIVIQAIKEKIDQAIETFTE